MPTSDAHDKSTEPRFASQEISRWRATHHPIHLWRAVLLLVHQRRTLELIAGLYWTLRHRVPAQPASTDTDVLALAEAGLKELEGTDRWARPDIADFLVRHGLAGDCLPPDFEGARREGMAVLPGLAVIGEYGPFHKRLCLVTATGCDVAREYVEDPGVRHVHAVFALGRRQFLVTTGDAARYRDEWEIRGHQLVLQRRLARSLAGHTAIARVNGRLVYGSDWSSRPNYLEFEDGRRHMVPSQASTMYTVAFAVPDGRHLVTLHKALEVLGGDSAVTVFDTMTDRFVHCAPGPMLSSMTRPMAPRLAHPPPVPG